MGCSDSKQTATDDQSKKPTDKPAADKKRDEEKSADEAAKTDGTKMGEDECSEERTREDAVQYIIKELDVRQENAEKLVDTINDDENEKLDKEEVKKLWSTVTLARDELKPLFEEADANNTGKVTTTEACRVLITVFPKMDEKGMRKMMRKYDTGDKIVQFGEFVIFYVFIKKARDDLRPVFEAADANDTGVVTLSEATTKLCEHFPSMDERSVKRMLYRCDDGNGQIAYEEFIHFYASLQMSKKAVLKKFKTLEKDADGKVSEKDVIKMLQEETGIDEDDCKTLVSESEDSNDARCTEEEFINAWSKITGGK